MEPIWIEHLKELVEVMRHVAAIQQINERPPSRSDLQYRVTVEASCDFKYGVDFLITNVGSSDDPGDGFVGLTVPDKSGHNE